MQSSQPADSFSLNCCAASADQQDELRPRRNALLLLGLWALCPTALPQD